MEPEKLLSENPGSVVFPRYAEDLAREGRTEEALDVLDRGLKANPSLASGYSVLADLLFGLHEEEKAVENLLIAIKIDPQMPRDLFRLGRYYLNHEPLKAETFFKTANVYAPDAGRGFDTGVPSLVPFEKTHSLPHNKPVAEAHDIDRLGESFPDTVAFADVPREFGGIASPGTTAPAVESGSEFDEKDDGIAALLESFRSDGGDVISPFEGEIPGVPSASETVEEVDDGAYVVRPLDATLASDRPLDFGIPDIEEEDTGNVRILDIQEEEGYDLAKFGFSVEEEEDVLTPEERAELLALSESTESAGENDEIPDVGDITAESGEVTVEGKDRTETDMPPAAFFGRLSTEEIEDLNGIERESVATDNDLDTEAGEGIDYSDILSALKPSGSSRPVDSDVEEVLSNLFADDLAVEPAETEPFPDLSEFQLPESLDSGDQRTDDSLMESFRPDTPSGAIPTDGSFDSTGYGMLETIPDDELTALEETIAEGAAFESITAKEAGLIHDFEPGKLYEPETTEPEAAGGVSPVMDEVLNDSDEPRTFVNFTEPGVEMGRTSSRENEKIVIETPAEEYPPFSETDPIVPPVHEMAVSRSAGAGRPVFGESSSLDDLIDEYIRVTESDSDTAASIPFEAQAPSVRVADVPEREPEPQPSPEPLPKPKTGQEPSKAKSSRDTSGYTATMAEIYISQGLLSRALEIFQVLAERDPSNQSLRNRIAELNILLEQHPDA